MRATRGPGDYTPVHGDASHYHYSDVDTSATRGGGWGKSSTSSLHSQYSHNDDKHLSDAERRWPADPQHPRMRFEPPPPPGPVDPWEGFTVHVAVAWGAALLCVWLGLRWMGAKHQALTGEMNDADRKRAELAEEEREKKVSLFLCVCSAAPLRRVCTPPFSFLVSTPPRGVNTHSSGCYEFYS